MKNLHVIPTDKPSRLLLSGFGSLFLTPPMEFKNSDTYQHIYITSDEQPKHNDYYTIDGKEIYYCNTLNPTRNNHYKKIILTTDQDLIKDGVQPIDDEFLEWFVKNPSCEEVEIESWETKDKWELDYKIIIPKEESIHLLSNNGRALFGYKTIIPKEEQCTCKEHDPYCCQIHGNCPTCVKEKPIHLLSCCKSLEECHCGKYSKQETLEEAAEINCESITHPYCDREKAMFIKGAKYQAERMYSDEMLKVAQQAILCNIKDALQDENYIIEYLKQFKTI